MKDLKNVKDENIDIRDLLMEELISLSQTDLILSENEFIAENLLNDKKTK